MKIIHVGKSINDFKINSLRLVSQITWTVGIVLVIIMDFQEGLRRNLIFLHIMLRDGIIDGGRACKHLLCCKISGGANIKLFDIRELYNEEYKEYIVGSQEIESQSLYFVYGEAKRGEEREMATVGHEEILFLLSGNATLLDGDKTIQLEPEQAVYIESDEVFTFTALSDCRYVVAGTHTTLHEH